MNFSSETIQPTAPEAKKAKRGRAIIGQKKGKTVSVSAPKGIIKYKIVKIEKNNG